MLRYLMRRMVKNSGAPYTIRKLVNVLESAGFKSSIALVSSYINMMKDSCFLKEITIYGTDKIKERNPKKLYTADHQMAVLFREFEASTGIILEHIILSVILRYSKLNPCYYRAADNLEVDFILSDDDGKPFHLIQVTDDFEKSREREIRALLQAMKETGLRRGIIISMDNNERIETESGVIEVIPAWTFALNAKNIVS